ncbi:MAG: DUF2189 domain-containing protein [Gammaproteobacteria bacterium]
MTRLEAFEAGTDNFPPIRDLTLDHPWDWLAKGWRDLQAAPLASLSYGVMFVIAGYLLFGLVFAAGLFYLVLPLLSGFLLVGPIVAMGLYEISRRRELGLAITLAGALRAWRANGAQIAAFGVILMLIFLAWMQLSILVFALMFDGVTPNWENFIDRVFLTAEAFPLLAAMTLLGAFLAVLVFAISAFAVPMLLDRTTNAFDAMRISVRAVRHNPRPMALWAAQIAAFTLLGLATFMIGLVVMLPLIGHATWHAYRDTIGPG